MKITIDNRTHWRTDHLRAFVARCMKDEREDLCRRGASAMRVRFVYTRRKGSSYSSGEAVLRSNWMLIRLSKHTPDKVDLAGVIAHELAHTRGMGHHTMRGNSLYRRVHSYRENYAWANELPLEVAVKKPLARPDVNTKLAHVEKKLKSARTREKRATTIRKKWEAKLKYYKKKLEQEQQTLAEKGEVAVDYA